MNLLANVTRGANVVKLLAKKKAPLLMIIGGGICMVGAIVTAVKSADKVKEDLEECKEEMEIINENLADLRDPERREEMVAAGFTEESLKRELVQVKAKTAGKVVHSFTPTLLFFVSGMGLIAGSHYIMEKRLNGVMAAYAVLDQSFKEYKERVKTELGDEKEKEIRYGFKKEDEVEVDNKEFSKQSDDNPYLKSPYSRFFDSSNKNWNDDPESNKFFLTLQQSTANDMLKARGHLFLNEVYDLLGMERSRAGAVVGWVIGGGDGYVDFGLQDIFSEANRRFNNGYEPVVLLDFNVDGVIYDKI